MQNDKLKQTMINYYMTDSWKAAGEFKEKIFSLLDKEFENKPEADAYEMKAAQYKCIADNFTPLLFDGLPFYFETGMLCPFSDGHYNRGMLHANGWVFLKNEHMFEDDNPERFSKLNAQLDNILHLICGPYVDTEHFPVPFKKIFATGLKGIYEEALRAEKRARTDEEKKFTACAVTALLSLKRMSERFSEKAAEQLRNVSDARERECLEKIRDTAARVPWNPPATVYEGLCTMAFMRKALGSIEGMGFNSFGRVDVLLSELYENDRKKGVTDEELFELICQFILIWDCHIDKTKIQTGGADYEYENALTLGGCDSDGNAVFNGITRMFLKAHMLLGSMYPKIKCRYSTKSPEEYLKLISGPLLKQQSILLYANDETIIPALIKNGFPEAQARDYTVSGCWDVGIDDYFKSFGGSYINTLRALEWGMYMPEDILEKCGLSFEPLSGCDSFEKVYSAVLNNILAIIRKKAEFEAEGGRVWHKAYPVCAFSSLLADPLERLRDFTAGGTRFNWEAFYLAALPDTVDSLLAIKNLCFEKKLCTVDGLIDACRDNWQNEALRQKAVGSPFYGDGSEESSSLFARLTEDIYTGTRGLPTAYGGEWRMGCYMYTEIIWWGKKMAATPNGRRNGEYISQGFTPSRMHRIESVTDVFASLRRYNPSYFASGSVINVLLPAAKMNPEILSAFLKGCAASGTHLMQINCVNREDLIKAQSQPENYRHIIVRVCGFSAPFVSLSREFQNEFLSRNYYD